MDLSKLSDDQLMLGHRALTRQRKELRAVWKEPVLDPLCRITVGKAIQRLSYFLKLFNEEMEWRASAQFPVQFNQFIQSLISKS